MSEMEISAFGDSGLNSEGSVLAKRPYIATSGRYKGQPVIAVNTGNRDASGNAVYAEKLTANATLRKDEWVDLEDQIIESARERLVIVNDLQSAGLTYNVGGLGTLISEWEAGSEITDAVATMDGETATEEDRQAFSLYGVPIPIIGKRFRIGERMLLASRNRGAALDVTTGTEAGRSVARTSERMVFTGLNIGQSNSRGDQYKVHGLLTTPGRATYQIRDWSDSANVTGKDILDDVLAMLRIMETENRHYGPFNLYIPGEYAFRLREDFKPDTSSDQTIEERLLAINAIAAIRISDVMPTGNVSMIQMERTVIDLGVASDVTTVQWQSGSGMTNYFMTYAAWAPRLKQDYDGHTGIMHGSVA